MYHISHTPHIPSEAINSIGRQLRSFAASIPLRISRELTAIRYGSLPFQLRADKKKCENVAIHLAQLLFSLAFRCTFIFRKQDEPTRLYSLGNFPYRQPNKRKQEHLLVYKEISIFTFYNIPFYIINLCLQKITRR